jgi:hypothetical protein
LFSTLRARTSRRSRAGSAAPPASSSAETGRCPPELRFASAPASSATSGTRILWTAHQAQILTDDGWIAIAERLARAAGVALEST